MLFNSFSFLIFFPVVLGLFFGLPKKFQKLVLLVASCYFYMSFVPKYIVILFALILIDFSLAKIIDKKVGVAKNLLLWLSVFSNIGTLFIFKYFNFFNENIGELAKFLHFNYDPYLLSLILPLGLSFHIFQSLGYVIDVYKGKQKPEKSLFTYALYVLFFPQLVAGPIERSTHMLPQLQAGKDFNPVLARKGLERMLWGFFKKMVIADQIAQIINPLYASLPDQPGTLIVISMLFTYQIYCDFSGYSDIAIGAAMVFGYELSENFNRPFSATTVADFWRRWHMSLSNWVRDYLYYPFVLGWGKASRFKMYYGLILTFLAIGLWHGANWTFIFFGLCHGVYIVGESLSKEFGRDYVKKIKVAKFSKIIDLTKTLLVFAFVSLTCIFFRSENMAKGWWFLSHIFTSEKPERVFLSLDLLTSHVGNIVLLGTVGGILILELVQKKINTKKSFYIFDEKKKWIRYSWYYFLITYICFFGFFGKESFIYFQF